MAKNEYCYSITEALIEIGIGSNKMAESDLYITIASAESGKCIDHVAKEKEKLRVSVEHKSTRFASTSYTLTKDVSAIFDMSDNSEVIDQVLILMDEVDIIIPLEAGIALCQYFLISIEPCPALQKTN